MSLYTPVFPSLHQVDSAREGLQDNNLTSATGKQRNYVEFLRDVHLFLSTQSDVLSPPSRPNSPTSEHRVQKVKDEVQDIFSATGDDLMVGKWTLVSQTLKLGCARGKRWVVPKLELRELGEDTDWILPDEESEWIEWEKKREEKRRLKGTTNSVSQQAGNGGTSVPPPHNAPKTNPNRANVAGSSQPGDKTREWRPPRVSPTVLRFAKEKVTKWQASVSSQVLDSTASGSSPSSSMATAAVTVSQPKTGVPQRSRTLDFNVVKPAAKSIVGKRGKSSLSQPTVGGCSTPVPSSKTKSPKSSKASNVPEETKARLYVGASSVKDDTPKIRDIPETPYLPPSFPANLKTSTPLATSTTVVRAKPSHILPIPASLSTPPPSVTADPPDDRQLISAEPHAANVRSFHPTPVELVQAGKRSQAPSTSLDGVVDDSVIAPPAAKKPRTISENRFSPVPEYPERKSSNEPRTRDNPNSDTALYEGYSMESHEMAFGIPLTPGKSDKPVAGAASRDAPGNIRSPAKSVKSYFSAPDSDSAESPMQANLLLESPVSPMLSYAQNPSGFLPQITSTQIRKGSPTPDRTNSGAFGIGYSSQFDVERHVDRVSELLEKDVDIDGWLRDVGTVYASQD